MKLEHCPLYFLFNVKILADKLAIHSKPHYICRKQQISCIILNVRLLNLHQNIKNDIFYLNHTLLTFSWKRFI